MQERERPFTWFLAGPIFVPSWIIPKAWREKYPEATYEKQKAFIWRLPIVRGLHEHGMGTIDPYSSDMEKYWYLYGKREGYLKMLEDVDGVIAVLRPKHFAAVREHEAHIGLVMEYWRRPFVLYAPEMAAQDVLMKRFTVAPTFGWIVPRAGIIRDYEEAPTW